MEDIFSYTIRQKINYGFEENDSILYAKFSSVDDCESEYDRLIELYGESALDQFYIDIE